jgi:pyridoxine 5-phosphate synthase
MPTLGVNIDHVATLREARKANFPDPVWAAVIAELAGAQAITCHLREDRRHMNDRDVELLRKVIKTRLNFEMAPTAEMVKKAVELKPETAVLVPEKREEVTTEGGLDVLKNKDQIRSVIAQLHEAEIKVSLFIDPDLNQIKVSHQVGANYIEIHTGAYADARNEEIRTEEFRKIANGVNYGLKLGLKVNAGHGLNYHNVQPIAAIEGIHELNIGHAIIAQAVFVGLEKAVRDMLELMA